VMTRRIETADKAIINRDSRMSLSFRSSRVTDTALNLP
jgi:hypothetical protein